MLELKNILTEDYLPDIIFDEIYVLDSGKIIHRIYVKYNGEFNIHNKNTWQGAYLFFNEAISVLKSAAQVRRFLPFANCGMPKVTTTLTLLDFKVLQSESSKVSSPT